ncbi:hypothetical protein K474DRAFT_1666285 [Panus rudis PR-1116 ss-1]|nr:hypothetical protein K474DRAFT_1666285 [Panus rudis PR-1116 ss-1]
MSNPELDLSKSEDLLTYLSTTPFASTKAVQLTGGYGNYVFRMFLRTEYEGRDKLVVKHGKPFIPGSPDLTFSLDRQKYEVEALKQVKSLLPPTSLVTVPTIHLFDDKAAIIVMDDCGENVINLKQLMLTSPPTRHVATKIGTELGKFLAFLHNMGRKEQNRELVKFLNGNEQAKRVSAWATHGRVVSSLKEDSTGLFSDTPQPFTQEQLDRLEDIAKKSGAKIAKASVDDGITMGDFWPGNILVDLSLEGDGKVQVKRLYLVDWELVKTGPAAADVGQFCAEMYQLRRFKAEECGEPATKITEAFLEAYHKEREGVDGKWSAFARYALSHIGAHLIVWTPIIDWGGKERTREVVLEGVKFFEDGYTGSEESVRTSVVGRLCF